MNIRCRLAALTMCLAGLASAPLAQAAEVNMYDGSWHFDLAIYGWLPKISADMNIEVPIIGGGSGSASISPSSYVSALQFAGMLALQARKGDVAIISDLDYVDFADLKTRIKNVSLPGGRVTLPLNEDLNMGFKALIWTNAVSYTVARSSAGSLDVAGGVRYFGTRTSLDWNYSGSNGVIGRSGSASKDTNLWDAVVGVYGQARLGDGRWYVPYYVDIGAGNESNWTSMAWAGLGYHFDFGDVLLVYKNLYYHQGADKPLDSMNLGGGALAVTFRW